jgi:hypothetical protein
LNRSALDALLLKISDFILSRNVLVRIKHQEPSFKRIVVLYRIASHCFILLACSKVIDLRKDKQTPYIVDNLADRGVVPDLEREWTAHPVGTGKNPWTMRVLMGWVKWIKLTSQTSLFI